ncbi:MAG TPA: hypothetical protein EYQ25_08480 [Planctomycetes bacterium]|nr:hypothetical protein [Planctomycetota bacterium]HIL37184.1 hypothetical protein [Planctomycetota bacterium]
MKATLTLLALPLSLLPLYGALQDEPKPQQPDPNAEVETRDLFGRVRTGAMSDLQLRIQGCWRLMNVSMPDTPQDGGSANGFLLISANFMSMEIQASWATPRVPVPDAFQTGHSEYSLGRDGVMTLTSLIGSYLDSSGEELIWEPGGMEREIMVNMPTINMLILESSLGPKLTFARNLPSNSVRWSIFGTEEEGPELERDPLGQPTPIETENEPEAEDVKTDIFGRPIKRTPADGNI